MTKTQDTPSPEDAKDPIPKIAQESPAEASDALPGAETAADPAEATPAPAGEAGEGNAPVTDGAGPQIEPAPIPDDAPPPAQIPDDPPVDDKVAKGKGDKARAATLGQVPAPKPKPAKTEVEDAPEPDTTVIRTRAFPGPLLAFGGRARRAGWAAGFEISAQNAADRTGRKMKLMITGNRAGPIEWKPEHLADELVADDWEVVVANDQLDLIRALMNGEASPA
jgi:hypothetical protein